MSRWSPQACPDEPDGLILFDGVCVFCSRWVRFVLARDRARRFRFAAIQSPVGRALAVRHGIDPDAPQTNAVILDGRIFFKSDAALTVLGRLPGLGALAGLRAVPRGLRDPVYDLIAKNRYAVFGRTETCMAPSPEDRARFVE
jgi:predicted DCC family thiol-disulfide oxidoreductase YuxK